MRAFGGTSSGALTRSLLFRLDAETAHGLSIAALKTGLPFAGPCFESERLKVRVAGLSFPNPLGLAAGYDKNAEVFSPLARLGFGFVECGTVTPRAQAGNDKPRVFRLASDAAVINRLGFNNGGHEVFQARLQRRRAGTIVGANIGANRDSDDRVADYVAGVKRFAPLASYLAVNISSPNTAGLRDLQARDQLGRLLDRVVAARSELTRGRETPIFVKIAPDLDEAGLADIAELALSSGIDGLIACNTTIARDGLTSANAAEIGGLSGRPLFARSTAILARLRQLVGPSLPLIGVGGVDSVETALEKIRAGADLVQLYTGMIYRGPRLPRDILRGMDRFARKEGLSSLGEIRDSRAAYWAGRLSG